MSAVFDTSILIRQQKGDKAIKEMLRSISQRLPSTPSITFINLFEYLMGIKALSKRRSEALRFVENFDIINTTERTPGIMARLKIKYDGKGIALSLSDLIIASLAIENDMTLVTSDEDFRKVEELEVEFIKN